MTVNSKTCRLFCAANTVKTFVKPIRETINILIDVFFLFCRGLNPVYTVVVRTSTVEPFRVSHYVIEIEPLSQTITLIMINGRTNCDWTRVHGSCAHDVYLTPVARGFGPCGGGDNPHH